MNSTSIDRPDDAPASIVERRHIQDELDTRVVFVPRAAKLLVAAIIVVILAIGVWSVKGKVPTKVVGSGIVLHVDQQIHGLQSSEAGRVVALKGASGDRVEANSVVAELNVPSLELELELARARRDDLRVGMTATQQRFAAELTERQELAEDEIRALTAAADTFQQQIDRMAPDDAGDQTAVLQLNDVAVRIAAIQSRLFEARADQAAALADLRQHISVQERMVSDLESRVAAVGQITAPVDGVIGEIRTQIGEVVSSGQVLLTVVSSSQGYEVLAFFPVEVGGRIAEDMAVHIVPDTVKQDQYGAIKGRVVSISDGPATTSRIDLLLGSADLASILANDTAAYVAHIELFQDSSTPSGFAWTSGDGPPYAVSSGTPARVDVVVSEEPPIALFVPTFRWLLAD